MQAQSAYRTKLVTQAIGTTLTNAARVHNLTVNNPSASTRYVRVLDGTDLIFVGTLATKTYLDKAWPGGRPINSTAGLRVAISDTYAEHDPGDTDYSIDITYS